MSKPLVSYKGLILSIATSLLNAFAFVSLNIVSQKNSIDLSSTAYSKFFLFGLSASTFSVFSAFINKKRDIEPTQIIVKDNVKNLYHCLFISVYALLILFNVDYSVLIGGAIAGFASISWNRVGHAKNTVILGLSISIIQAISALASILNLYHDDLFGYLMGILSLFLLSRKDVFAYWLSTQKSIFDQSFSQITLPSLVHAIVVNTPNLILLQAINLPLSSAPASNLFLATEKISGVVEKSLFSAIFYSGKTSFNEYQIRAKNYFKLEKTVLFSALLPTWFILYLLMRTSLNLSYTHLLGSFLIALSGIYTIVNRSSCGMYFNYLLQLICANTSKKNLAISGLRAQLICILIPPLAIFFLARTHGGVAIWAIMALLPVQYLTIKSYNKKICMRCI